MRFPRAIDDAFGGVQYETRFAYTVVMRSVAVGAIDAALPVLTCRGAMTLAASVPLRAAPRSRAGPKARRAAKAAAASGVDTVIALVKGGMSEALVIRTLKSEGKTYKLSTADLLKLQKAGVSETIIDAMTDPAPAVERRRRRPRRRAAATAAAVRRKPSDRRRRSRLTLRTFLPSGSGGWRSDRSTTRRSRPG